MKLDSISCSFGCKSQYDATTLKPQAIESLKLMTIITKIGEKVI